MADSPISSWDQAVSGATDDLLATKLSIPQTRRGRVARSRLFERLDQGMAQELILVCAPAGFGKTTLLADWATTAKCPVGWLSLDPQDNDPVRFWRYVVAALDRACEGLAERLLPVLTASRLAVSQGVPTMLINQLEAGSGDIALVLDDYHAIDSSAIHEGIGFLLRRLPTRLHVVIASRSDPPLPLARLRATGELLELRAADLRFTAEEAAAFLHETWGLNLLPEAVAALETRTEGWAVGLQLAALSLRKRPDPDAFLEEFTGSHRYVLDYLSEEVLDRQPETQMRFLLETSLLEQLCGPLCDAVTGRSDGTEMLEELERAGLFVVPLDEERRWYRLHHLFRDLLRARLQHVDEERLPTLHRRAAAWCEQHGLIDYAIRHASAAGDAPWAARVVEQHLGETLRRGESGMLTQWLALLPDDAVRSRPALCLALGLMELHLGHLESVERLLEHAERAVDPQAQRQTSGSGLVPTDGGMVAEVPAAIALLRAELASARGDPERTAKFARSARSQLADEERGPRLWVRWLELLADWMSGHMEKAESGFAQILTEARTTADPHPLTLSCHTLGWVQQDRGELDAALRTYREGLRFATESGRFLAFHAGEAHVGIAQVLFARNELETALWHVTQGIELTRQVVEFQLSAFGLVILGRIRQAMADADGANEAIDEACRLLPATDVTTMFSPAQTERAGLWLAQGRVQEAAHWTEERGLTDHDELSYPRERDYLVLARVLMAQSEPSRALRLLERMDALADSQGRIGNLIEIRALRSLAQHAIGDHDGAKSLLVEALALAQPAGYIQVFVDEGPQMAALLRSLSTSRKVMPPSAAVIEHLRQVIVAFQRPKQTTDTARSAGLIQPLTDRELEVLRLLAAGWRNRDIARQLVVTLDTVKKHISHIFDKLGAANRTEAVDRARKLGILS
jgi:LuxR family transcriptional regulator, maltose regulon positive regulatory protein